MFVLNPANITLTSNLSGDNAFGRSRSPLIHAGSFPGRRRKAPGSRVNRNVTRSIRAVISSGGGKTADATTTSPACGTVPWSSSSSSGSDGIQVRAVVAIRKKMKEKIAEKLEDQWECLVNGFGLGIQMLISEEIDPEHKDMLEHLLFGKMMKKVLSVGERFLKYDIPAIIKSDRFSWLRDNEFARQTLAGVNPVNIELLKEFPIRSKLDPAEYGPSESAITKELLEEEIGGMSLEKAIEEKRLFILDFHDMLLPFIRKINSLPGRKAYASRTILFHTPKGILWPLAIELSLPPTPSSPRNK